MTVGLWLCSPGNKMQSCTGVVGSRYRRLLGKYFRYTLVRNRLSRWG